MTPAEDTGMRRCLLLTTLAALLLCAPALASRPASFTGRVLGPAVPVRGGASLPVLLDANGVRRTKLHGALAMVTVPRKVRPLVGKSGRLAVGDLRAGDSVSLHAPVTRALRGQQVPALRATWVKVTRRGADPAAAVTQQLEALQLYVAKLAAYTIAQFQSVRADLASQRADLSDLRATLATLRTLLGGTPSGAALDQITALQTQVTALAAGLSTLGGKVNTLSGQIGAGTGGGADPAQLAKALSDIAALQTATAGLNAAQINGRLAALAQKIGAVGPSDLRSQVAALQSLLTTLQGRVNVVCSPNAKLLSGPLSLIGLSQFPGC